MNGIQSSQTIRLARGSDIPQLVSLVNGAFAIETFLEGTRTNPAQLAEHLEKGEILVLEDPSGLLLASVYVEPRGACGYMGMLAVHPAHQRAGLARRVIAAAEDRLRAAGCRAVEISVLSARPELLAPYRRFGFVETGTEPFTHRIFRPGASAAHLILMSKPL